MAGLHPALKRGLDLDVLHAPAADLVGDTPDCHGDGPDDAKRRRVEAVALGCLRGRLPVLITSALRGPFDSSWSNPWAKPVARASATPARRPHATRRDTQRRRASPTAHAAEPETSRAAEPDLGTHDDDQHLSLPTAPVPDDSDNDDNDGDDATPPAATESFPSNTHEYISNRTPLSNPFWLRRPPASTTRPVSAATHKSPLRSRARPHHHATAADLQLALPTAPLGRRNLPTEADTSDNMRSSASASMLISTPPDSSRDRADSAQEEDDATLRSSQAVQNAQPALPPNTPSVAPSGLGTTASPSSQSFPHHQQSARSAHIIVPATTYKTSTSVHVPRSASVSSTGFVYRRVGGSKGKSDARSKTKPRAISFSSPSAVNTGEANAESLLCAEEEAPEIDNNNEGGQQETCQSNKNSAYSTQAAMLLAQLEFQEDLSQSTSPETLRPWSRPASNTPRPALREASPAITPLSVFNKNLENTGLGDSVLRGAPVSTQDLFTAASPFAFSTVKKKSANPLQNSLRFALAAGSAYGASAEKTTVKSPTPSAERLPLKDKNARVVASFTSGKASQTSQTSQTCLLNSPTRVSRDMELPQLDFHTSLDDFGPNGDVHFTDRFLAGLGET